MDSLCMGYPLTMADGIKLTLILALPPILQSLLHVIGKSWMMRESDIKSLSAAQIQYKFALKSVSTEDKVLLPDGNLIVLTDSIMGNLCKKHELSALKIRLM